MKKLSILSSLILLTSSAFAQKVLSTEQEIASWVATSIQYPSDARLTQVTDKLDFTIRWNMVSGKIQGIDFAKEYYPCLQAGVINSLSRGGNTPTIQLDTENDGAIELSFDFSTLLTAKEAKKFTKVESHKSPSYQGDTKGNKLILDNASLNSLQQLYAAHFKQVYAQVELNSRKCSGYIFVYIDNQRNVIADIDESFKALSKWQQLKINGKNHPYFGLLSCSIEELLTPSQLQEAKAIKKADIRTLFIRTE